MKENQIKYSNKRIILSLLLISFNVPFAFAQDKYVLTEKGFVIKTDAEEYLKKISTPPAINPNKQKYSNIVSMVAQKHGVEPALIHAIIKAESNYDTEAISSAGAKGLMQLMDETAQHYKVINVFDPYENINAGTELMRDLLDRYNSVYLALAAYNAGIEAIEKYKGMPPYEETRNYVRSIMAEYTRKTGRKIRRISSKKRTTASLMIEIPKEQTLLYKK